MTIRTFATLLSVLVIAHLLDATVTIVGIRHGIPEDNPIEAAALARAGLFGMDVLKLAMVALAVLLLWRVKGRYRAWQVWVVALCLTVPTLAIAALNAVTIRGG